MNRLLHETHDNARRHLLAAQGPHGHWVGQLSASALSTATAVFALSRANRPALVPAGVRWLVANQNPDGGWGDTVRSVSNISTTALCWAALAGHPAGDNAASLAEQWLNNAAGSLEPAVLAKAIADKYGKDRTFSVPILTMLAIAGRLGPDPWRLVPQLPFELAALPFEWFQVVRLPVVSYALPALIAIGHARHANRPGNLVSRTVRNLASPTTLRLLREIQPTTGGYLEATPLTSFVLMSLVSAGLTDHPVVPHAVEFLERSVRPDGSWPIDTNLATWVTTLAVNALGGGTALGGASRLTVDWLLNQQYRTVHPYTRAAPGGWAWTDLSGGVPDADDTPGALLALAKLGEPDAATLSAAVAGVTWLLDLQNDDGGIPTFCKGWTGLPFDRSSNDLTAHALLAWGAWFDRLPASVRHRVVTGAKRATRYLSRTQRRDGAWAPLWFGNQHAAEIENLTCGTSRVLRLAELLTPSPLRGEGWGGGERSHPGGGFTPHPHPPPQGGRGPDRTRTDWFPASWNQRIEAGVRWLVANQNPDGGWGGRAGTPSSVEETGLALEGLASAGGNETAAIDRGVRWLAEATDRGTRFPASPIGFYFANLWYFEELYPVIFTVAGLSRVAAR